MRAQLILENLEMRYPHRVLFEKVNWTIYEGQRIALAGRNGSGKSTLLRILADRMEAHEGTRTIVGGRPLKMGYLDQSLIESAVTEGIQLGEDSRSALTYVEEEIADPAVETWEIKKILSGLGFSPSMMEAPMSRLSGGWMLRLFIGATLAKKPDMLLLDEPTNHLDLSTIQWLESFLRDDFEGTLLLVTHDVTLQKRVTDSLAVVHGGQFYYRSNQRDYLTFLESLKEEQQILERSVATLERKVKDHEDFVARFRTKARMASRAQSKIKASNKLKEELTELRDRVARIKGFEYKLNFRFKLDRSGARFPISLHEVCFKYPSQEKEESPWILKDVSFDIRRGQKVAIIGDNGAGKTTLLNVVAGRLKSTEGSVKVGHATELGYFGQHQIDELSLENTVTENLSTTAPDASYEQIRGWLGAFGFTSEQEVEKKVKLLSGGEKARLALLRILASSSNVVLLDEPTNHLDIETRELLKDAIRQFEGTVLFISHDREFVSSLAERVIYLSSDHKLTDHAGDFDSFCEKYPDVVHNVGSRSVSTPSTTAGTKSKGGKEAYEARKQRRNRIRSLEKKIATLETDLSNLGSEKETLEEESAQDAFYAEENADRKTEVFQRLESITTELNRKMIEWEKLSTELEKLNASDEGAP